MEKIYGIDLGTTHSLIAHVVNGTPQVIPGETDKNLIPSVIALDPETQKRIVGDQAKQQLITHPESTIYSVKRLMGKGKSDLAEELKRLPFDFSQSQDEIVKIKIGKEAYTPIEISAMILRHIKKMAENRLNEKVKQVVITVPAYFNDAERQATQAAGALAGLEVVRIINEPTAAALAYGLQEKKNGLIAVYDLGGGTFDISILNLHDGIFDVLSTNGNTHLGGDDVDHAIMDWFIESAKIPHQKEYYPSIIKEATRSKIELSQSVETTLKIGLAGKTYQANLNRETFNHLIQPLIQETLHHCEQALADAQLKTENITDVVMVGGSTRIPYVRSQVEQYFGKKPNISHDPDEVVALGAAVQGDVLAGGNQDILLLDIVPLSLGIETMGGVVTKLIHRNSKIPISAKEGFTTWVEGQTKIHIHVLQGEREFVKDCRSLGEFVLEIPPQPLGLPRIEVTFSIDANGILNVSAKDLRSNQAHTLTIKPSYGLTDEQVEKMLEDAYAHAKDDLEQRQLVEYRNEADQIIKATEKALSKQEKLITAEEEKKIQQLLSELKSAAAQNNLDHLKQKLDQTSEGTQHLAEVVMDQSLKKSIKGTKI